MPRSAEHDPVLHVPRRAAADPAISATREWLVTNGLGGFASGTVAGCLTRRYHALLTAAIEPPVVRFVTWAKLDERLAVGAREHRLSTNVWQSGLEEPAGCRLLRRFDLVLGVPTWCFESPEFRLWKRIWMEQGRNTTYVQYVLDRAAGPATIEFAALVDYRDYHHLPRGEGRAFRVTADHGALAIHAGGNAPPTTLHAAGNWTRDHTWYRGFMLPVERDRGFDHVADYLCAGHVRMGLQSGKAITIVGSTEPRDFIDTDGERAFRRHFDAQRAKLAVWNRTAGAQAAAAPPAVRQLVLAADQFIVVRPGAGIVDAATAAANASNARHIGPSSPPPRSGGKTIIAGYPWFTDWGRDTMIAIPGLTLATGRSDVARDILLTFANHVNQGMLPNRFTDKPAGGASSAAQDAEYNTADATLWFFWAIGQYFDATGDIDTLRSLYPVLLDIVGWHRRGTRYNIHVDGGLLHAGQPGVQLTWMDAKCGDWVVTPRIGKPIELSALWYAALLRTAQFSRVLGRPDADCTEFDGLAGETRAAFARFWNPARNCCYDVLDGPNGHESAIRPNQLFAVSLAADVASGPRAGRNVASGGLGGRGVASGGRAGRRSSESALVPVASALRGHVASGPRAGRGSKITPHVPSTPHLDSSPLADWLLPPDQCRAIVDTCESRLLTWFGLRSLDPADPAYCPHYAGGPRERDGAYHQGTAWGWLLGPFAIAHALVHGDSARAREFLSPMLAHLWSAGVGSLSEIFDAAAPHRPDGCPAQAWSVAETLRACHWLAD